MGTTNMSMKFTLAFLIILISLYTTNCSKNLMKVTLSTDSEQKPPAASAPAPAASAPAPAPVAPAPSPAVPAPVPVPAPVLASAGASSSSNSTAENKAEDMVDIISGKAESEFFTTIFPKLDKIDEHLHRNIEAIYISTLRENLMTKKDLCNTVKTQGMLDTLDGEFDMIKKTNFTHPKVDFEDKYTPFLLKLREKYEQREKNVTEIDMDFHKNKEEFTSLAKTFLENSAKIITLFKDALVTLKEFSTAKTLKNPSSIEESFNEFKDQKFPLLTNGTFVEDCFDTYMSFKKFCVQDLLGKQCVVLTNKTEATTSFKNKFAKLKDYNLKNSSRVYAEDIYAVTLNVMNIFMTASDIISNANLNSNFNGVTKEYLGELQAMNAYLKNKKAVKISDFDHLDKNGANVINFERDFKNLIQSTKFICFNVQKPFFFEPIYNPKPDIENEKKEDKLNRIITEFDKLSNEQNILFDDSKDYNATTLSQFHATPSGKKPDYEDNLDIFDKRRHLDCMKKTNFDKILLKSPCFNDLNEKEKKVVNKDTIKKPTVKPTKNDTITPTKNDTITPTKNDTIPPTKNDTIT